ncbi:sugar ABC transporter ATP-binding protein [Salipiger sp. P9]|uniref:sugar ABC transporter ATP-binding protein n=1 Tax=Salipiger pentaromativorans TaxID=2943193 RepID=UPI00215708D1|nr:sugar ABC transporter ATP-binding protein [Salipiger pentaromativorans]MCR8548940.1 sugar ABC transporter ATP-binding protein [Salipiger pentaromativorans]
MAQIVEPGDTARAAPRPPSSLEPHGPVDPAHAGAPLLRLEGITKRYPGTLALDSVDFDVRPGEVHVLFGENGAGKSTLIQTIAGVHRPSSGRIFLRGREVTLESVRHARTLGISAVFQEFSIVPQMTVEENLFLGDEPRRGGMLDKRAVRRMATEVLDRLGFELRPGQHALYLSRAEQQMVEIAKAFCTRPSVVILDEPTASLTERETERLFELIEQLKSEGIGIVYITHRMSEIQRIGDRITVLRDGRYIETLPVAGTTQERLVALMTGRVVDQIFPQIRSDPGEELLRLDGICASSGSETVLEDVSIRVRAGEVVGIAGLVGSGKSEIGRAAFGILRPDRGSIQLRGETVFDADAGIDRLGPRAMLDRGLIYVPPDRREEGLAMVLPARENMSLAALDLPGFSRGGLLRRSAEKRDVSAVAKRLALSPMNIERRAEHFSGGNQQKVLIGKALLRIGAQPEDARGRVVIFDEPTVGVDIGARMLIYRAMRDLCEAGAGVVLISSDLPEILHLAHRSYVMHRARLRADLPACETTEETVLSHFFDPETD